MQRKLCLQKKKVLHTWVFKVTDLQLYIWGCRTLEQSPMTSTPKETVMIKNTWQIKTGTGTAFGIQTEKETLYLVLSWPHCFNKRVGDTPHGFDLKLNIWPASCLVYNISNIVFAILIIKQFQNKFPVHAVLKRHWTLNPGRQLYPCLDIQFILIVWRFQPILTETKVKWFMVQRSCSLAALCLAVTSLQDFECVTKLPEIPSTHILSLCTCNPES